MNHGQASANAFVSICSRNPIAVLAISDFLAKAPFAGCHEVCHRIIACYFARTSNRACRRVFNTGMAGTGARWARKDAGQFS